MQFELETITPELAARILETVNQDNFRKLRPHWVEALANIIRRGDWVPDNGETVKFDRLGNLTDGQHRLAAIARAGRTVQVAVVRNVVEDPTSTDGGIRRVAEDDFKRMGLPSSRNLAAAANILWHHEAGKLAVLTHRTDRQNLVRVVTANPELKDSEPVGRAVTQTFGGSTGAYIFLHYLFSREDAAAANEFFRLLLTGNDLEPRSPLVAVRNAITRECFRNVMVAARVGIPLTIDAWNYWRQGRNWPTNRSLRPRRAA